MAISITCPSCGAEYAVRDDVAGTKVRCSSCQTVIEVPDMAAPLETVPAKERPDSPPVKCGFATASLVLGIVGVMLPCIGQLLAIIFGFIALNRISRSEGRMIGNRKAIAGLALGFVWIVVISVATVVTVIILPAVTKSRESARKAVCMNNLRQIGLALAAYSSDYDGFPPSGGKDSLENLSLLFPTYISARNVFVCPSANDDASGIKEGTPFSSYQCSYEYIPLAPTGPDGSLPPDAIIAFDKSENNHRWKGRNVLFKDGHVQWMQEWSFKREYDEQWELRGRYRIAPHEVEAEEEAVEDGEVLKIEIEER